MRLISKKIVSGAEAEQFVPGARLRVLICAQDAIHELFAAIQRQEWDPEEYRIEVVALFKDTEKGDAHAG